MTIHVPAGVPFVCRHFVSARAEVPKRRLCNSFSQKGHRLGNVLRSLCRNEEEQEDMSDYNEQTLMEAVIKRVAATPDPRLRQIMTSLVRYLHGCVRE